jgi:hypothetical protein
MNICLHQMEKAGPPANAENAGIEANQSSAGMSIKFDLRPWLTSLRACADSRASAEDWKSTKIVVGKGLDTNPFSVRIFPTKNARISLYRRIEDLPEA